MVRQLQAVASDMYSAIADARFGRYSFKSNRGSILHMYEGVMQSSLMERFSKGIKKRMPEDSYRNKLLNSLVINSILNDIENKWVGSKIDQERKRDLLMSESYICMTYVYSLR